MKILHYINDLGSGGAEKLLTDILPLMKKKGHTVDLVYSNNRKNVVKFDEILRSEGVLLKDFCMSYYNPFQIIKLIRLLRSERYDIVHAHIFPTQYWLSIASIWKPSSTKLFKTEHSVFNRRRSSSLMRPIERWIYSNYNTIIAITPLVKVNLITWLNKIPTVIVIKNGINLQQLELMKEEMVSADYSLFDSESYNILMVGRFNYEKDQSALVVALSILPDRYKIFFVGEGEQMDRIKQKVIDLNLSNRVHFLGFRTDVYSLMSLTDLNVLSTHHEGLSGVALESMASGRPFIGSDVEGVNDIVPDEAFLFPKNDPEGLAKKIMEVSVNKEFEDHLTTKGLEHVKVFDMDHMVEDYLNAYQTASE